MKKEWNAPEPTLTPEQVAENLQISLSQAYRLPIPWLKVGNRGKRVTLSAFELWKARGGCRSEKIREAVTTSKFATSDAEFIAAARKMRIRTKPPRLKNGV